MYLVFEFMDSIFISSILLLSPANVLALSFMFEWILSCFHSSFFTLFLQSLSVIFLVQRILWNILNFILKKENHPKKPNQNVSAQHSSKKPVGWCWIMEAQELSLWRWGSDCHPGLGSPWEWFSKLRLNKTWACFYLTSASVKWVFCKSSVFGTTSP